MPARLVRFGATMNIERDLGVQELRMRVLEHTRKAFALLPAIDRPRILDIGCGQGVQTLELARLGGGEVVGIDIDETVLTRFHQRLEQSDVSSRVTVRLGSLFDLELAAESFDILWEEGVLHLLEPARSFAACHRLLRPEGFLVMHETLAWFEAARQWWPEQGLVLVDRHLLPRHFWWTEYGAPLERRVRELRESHADAARAPELARHAKEAAMIKADPDRFDCGFFILQKRV
jgi:2-polyprenyl-3-methyl-5-hydroxy-6-metoxy-1,4-benzoquinol methylase